MADLLYEADELYDAVLFDYDGHAQSSSGSGNGSAGGADNLHLVSGSDKHLIRQRG